MTFAWNPLQPGRAAAPQFPCVVNYIWMDADPQYPLPIPSHLFCRVQQNAKRYPHTQFRVWGESPGIAADYIVPPNVTICTLDDVPSFADFPVFQSPTPSNTWTRVDIARLLVVRHLLAEPGIGAAVYSDFDVPNVRATSRQLQKRLSTYGCAFGAVFGEGLGPIRVGGGEFENSYFAFTPNGAPFLDHIIGCVSRINGLNDTLQYRSRIYVCMRRAINGWSIRDDNNIPSIKEDYPHKQRLRIKLKTWERKVAFQVAHPTKHHVGLNLKAKRIPAQKARAIIMQTAQPAG